MRRLRVMSRRPGHLGPRPWAGVARATVARRSPHRAAAGPTSWRELGVGFA